MALDTSGALERHGSLAIQRDAHDVQTQVAAFHAQITTRALKLLKKKTYSHTHAATLQPLAFYRVNLTRGIIMR